MALPADAKPPIKKPASNAEVKVLLRDPQNDATDPAYRIAKKLHLEAGAVVRPTCFLDDESSRTNRDLYILLATERVEGGYDAVNLYDRGIVSWGVMQWTAHQNSLQNALLYVKTRLADKGRADLWATLFKTYGLDVQQQPGGEPAFCVGGTNKITGVTAWRPITGIDNLRVLFRGTKDVGRFDPATVTLWAKVFARAGRVPVVQSIQNEWATKRLHECLGEKVDADWTIASFTGSDLFTDALHFALWTNNPVASREHFRQAVRQTRLVTGEADPVNWPPALFPYIYEQVVKGSTFGTWPRRAESVAEVIPAGSVGRQNAKVQLASRGWNVASITRTAGRNFKRGQLWHREKPQIALASLSLSEKWLLGPEYRELTATPPGETFPSSETQPDARGLARVQEAAQYSIGAQE